MGLSLLLDTGKGVKECDDGQRKICFPSKGWMNIWFFSLRLAYQDG